MTVLPDDLNRRLEYALGSQNAADFVTNLLDALPRAYTIKETVTLTNDVTCNLSTTVPAGAVITSVQANLDTAVVGDASGDDLLARVGIGVAADPDKYGMTATLAQNQKVNTIPAWTVLGSAEQIAVRATKTDGTAATEKFVAGARVRVEVGYLFIGNSLPSK